MNKITFLSNRLLVLAFILLFVGFSCREPEDLNQAAYAIELTATPTGTDYEILINWPLIDLSDFESYILLRSAHPIADPPTLSAIDQNLVFKTFSNFEENSFLDEEGLPVPHLYYKLIVVRANGNFILSSLAEVEQDFINFGRTLSGTMKVIASEDLIYIHNRNSDSLLVYNYRERQVVRGAPVKPSEHAHGLMFTVERLASGMKAFFYYYVGEELVIYDAESLTEESTTPMKRIYSLQSDGENFVYVSNADYDKSILIWDINTLDLINSIEHNQNAQSTTAILNKEEHQFLVVNIGQIYRYDFSPSAELINTKAVPTNNHYSLTSIAVSPDGQYFLPYLNGEIYDKDLNFVTKIHNGDYLFQGYAFSEDGGKLFCINTALKVVEQFSFPALEKERDYPLNFSGNTVFCDENELFVIGTKIIEEETIRIVKSFEIY